MRPVKLQILFKAYILSVLLLSLTGCGSKQQLNGNAFIVTEGQGNVKLGLVQISAFNAKMFKDRYVSSLKTTNSIFKPLINRLQGVEFAKAAMGLTELMVELSRNNSSDKYREALKNQNDLKEGFRDMPKSYQTMNLNLINQLRENASYSKKSTKTDADGNFTFNYNSNDDYLIAVASRLVGEKYEQYAWLIQLDETNIEDKIYLSNDNLSKKLPEAICSALDLNYDEIESALKIKPSKDKDE